MNATPNTNDTKTLQTRYKVEPPLQQQQHNTNETPHNNYNHTNTTPTKHNTTTTTTPTLTKKTTTRRKQKGPERNCELEQNYEWKVCTYLWENKECKHIIFQAHTQCPRQIFGSRSSLPKICHVHCFVGRVDGRVLPFNPHFKIMYLHKMGAHLYFAGGLRMRPHFYF